MAVPGVPPSITRRIVALSAMARYSGLPIATVNAPCPSIPWHPEQFCLYNTPKSATSLGRTAGGSATLPPGDPHDVSATKRISAPYFIASAPHDAPALSREPLYPYERSTVLAGGWEFVPERQPRDQLQLQTRFETRQTTPSRCVDS